MVKNWDIRDKGPLLSPFCLSQSVCCIQDEFSEALWKDCILLRFPHIYWTIFFMEHSVLAPMLAQTTLDKSPSEHRLLGDLLFLLLGVDSKGNAGMCKPGLSLGNHLWRLDYCHPSVFFFFFLTLNIKWQLSKGPQRESNIHQKEATTWNWPLAGSRPEVGS